MKISQRGLKDLYSSILPNRSRSRDEGEVHFVYTGQHPSEVPRDVTHVRVDPSVISIGERAFYDCEHLEEVELYQGLRDVGDRAFRNCRRLVRVAFPSTVRSIDESAFQDCASLAEAGLREGLVGIGWGAFRGCVSLVRVTVPSTVEFVGTTPSSARGCGGSIRTRSGTDCRWGRSSSRRRSIR